MRLCFSPTLPSLRRIQFCIAPTSEPLAPVRRTAQSCRAACLSVPGQTLRCIFCTHSGSSHLRFCVRGLLLRSSGRTSGRFSILFQSSVTSFFLYNIRNLANIKGKKSRRIFISGQTPSGVSPLPVWTPQRFPPFCRQTRSLTGTRVGVRKSSV